LGIFKVGLHVGGSGLQHKLSIWATMDGPKVLSWRRRIRNKSALLEVRE